MSQEASPTAVCRVGISGSYGGLNLGDEAILQGIVGELARSLPVEITVFSRDAADTRARHPGVARVVPVRELSRSEVLPEIERLDVFVLGGGGILFDGEAKIYLREVQLALERGVPVMVYAVSAGPLRTPEAQALVRDCLSAVDIVTVRDTEALKLLEEIGVKRDITVTADPALLLRPEPLPADALEREGVRPDATLIGLSVREPGEAAPDLDSSVYNALLANAADFMVERFDADVVFVPMEPRMLDMAECHAVVSRMMRARRATVLKGDYTSGQLLALFARFAFAVGMRLHFLIFAALQRVPFVALPYSGKVGGFVADMGMAMPPMDQVNAGRLLAHIDESWDRQAALRQAIDRQLPALRLRAAETNRILTRFLGGRAGRRKAGAEA